MARRFGVHDALRVLSEQPTRIWPGGIVHHGARLLLLFALALLTLALFPVAAAPDLPVLEKGMVAEEDVIARIGFPIYKSDEDLSRERAEAAAGVAPIFEYVPAASDTMQNRVGVFLARIDSLAATSPDSASRTALRRVLELSGFTADDATLEALHNAAQRKLLARSLEGAIRAELPIGIASAGELEGLQATQLRLRREGKEELMARDSLRTAQRFFERSSRHLQRGLSPSLAELQRLILIRFFEPSVRLDRTGTDAARERARQAVPDIKSEVLKGEKIVGAHEQVRDGEMERLLSYRDQLTRLGEIEARGTGHRRTFGMLLYNLSLLSIFGVLLLFFRRAVYNDVRHVLLVSALIAALLGAAAVIPKSGWPVELVPIALPVIVMAALWDGRMALSLALVLAVLLSGQAPFLGFTPLYTFALGGSAAALGVRVVRRRSQTWVFAAIVAAAYAIAALTLGLLRSREGGEVLMSMAWGTLNAMGSALIAVGFLPLIEAFTRITTDQKLLELSDMNHPLLQRLQREAVGTFSHTLNVANLAEAAARAIGANALLTRVGAYYHDVGKVAKAHYFIENQPTGRNPHDKLKPQTSAAIVRNHVLEGLRLAEEAKLPDCVKAFVGEHHGTQSISFFFERARELDPDGELEPRDFAYPGPRPQSKETAILMLADSVESAARVLQDPTPERVRALIDRIVESKVAQGQLDESPLTFGDLTRIKEQFATGLGGIYHHRIDYPTSREEPEAAPTHRAAAGRG